MISGIPLVFLEGFGNGIVIRVFVVSRLWVTLAVKLFRSIFVTIKELLFLDDAVFKFSDLDGGWGPVDLPNWSFTHCRKTSLVFWYFDDGYGLLVCPFPNKIGSLVLYECSYYLVFEDDQNAQKYFLNEAINSVDALVCHPPHYKLPILVWIEYDLLALKVILYWFSKKTSQSMDVTGLNFHDRLVQSVIGYHFMHFVVDCTILLF